MTEKLHYSKLKKCYKSKLSRIFTENINDSSEITMGQERAINALKLGLNIKHKNYNIYLSGESGLGKTFFAKKYVNEVAKNENIPNDLVYVYNFKNENTPKLLTFTAGNGKIFKKDIENLVHSIITEVSNKFNSEKYLNEKEEIIKEYQRLQDNCINNIGKIAEKKGFQLKNNKNSFYFIPIENEEVTTEEDFVNLPYDKKDDYNKTILEIQKETIEYAREIKSLEIELKDKLISLEYNTFLFIVGYYTSFLQEKYIDFPSVLDYINSLKEDIILNRYKFIEPEIEEELMQLIPAIENNKPKENVFEKYNVNLFLDNSETKYAPVILGCKPTYTNLVGTIEFDNDAGNFFTDYMKIKSGLLHKANGGYLILKVKDLLNYPYALETLINTLETGKIDIELSKEQQSTAMPLSYIKPESVALNLKVILIGSEYYYDILSEFDDSFLNLFKINSVFDYEMDDTDENILNLINFIKKTCKSESLLELNLDAINVILQHLNKIAETQNKFTTKVQLLTEILIEANYFAISENSSEITDFYIKKAIQNKIDLNNMYEQKLNNMILENDIMIESKGFKVGQINGLAVLDYGEYSFGKPIKITATTYMGEEGIINIEKEANISGNIHNKGVQILSGYLGQKYAKDFPLSLSCNICLEQNYNGVEGDSCTSTELYAILSSLSEVPINQEIAVTGSINQKGEIQPIGGVTQKIEGFFDICNQRGLTGSQAVIIPYQNVKDLCLKDEVILAVKENKFAIYPIKNIDEGIEILTGVPAGELDDNGNYPENSIHFKALQKLKTFFENLEK